MYGSVVAMDVSVADSVVWRAVEMEKRRRGCVKIDETAQMSS